MPQLATYVGLVHRAEQTLADSLRTVGQGHGKHPDVLETCELLAGMSDGHVRRLAPVARRYGEQDVAEPERLHAAGLAEVRSGPVGLLRDLQDLHALASLVQTSWTVLLQAAQALRDEELMGVARGATGETARQLAWLVTRMKAAAPQTLVMAP